MSLMEFGLVALRQHYPFHGHGELPGLDHVVAHTCGPLVFYFEASPDRDENFGLVSTRLYKAQVFRFVELKIDCLHLGRL